MTNSMKSVQENKREDIFFLSDNSTEKKNIRKLVILSLKWCNLSYIHTKKFEQKIPVVSGEGRKSNK